MNQQPKRQLKKSRKYDARPSSSGSSNAGEGGWLSAYPKTKTKPACRRGDDGSDSDDDLRLDQLKSSKKRLGKKSNKHSKKSVLEQLGKKPSKHSKKSVGKKRWDDGCSSDEDSSSSDSSLSSESSVEINKKGNASKATVQFKATTQAKKKDSKPKTKTISRSSLNKVRSAGVREHTTPYNAPRSGLAEPAETNANRATIPEDITSVSQLQWYRMRLFQTEERTRERLQPCRVLSRGEAVNYHRKMGNGKGGSIDGKKTIQYLTLRDIDKGMYKIVDGNTLIPFGYPARDGLSTTFNDDYLQRYMQQERKITSANTLEETRLFLKRVFDHARETERKSRERASKDLQDYYDDSSSSGEDDGMDGTSCKVSEDKRVQFEVLENTEEEEEEEEDDHNEMDDLDVPYTQAITFDPDDLETEEEKSNEPIRPGDVIEYYSPIYVAGDARGLRQASVLSVRPNDETPLVLSNGEVLPNDIKVKRIKVMMGGEVLDHPGIYRPIYRFLLVRRGSATAADAITMEASRFGRIMQKNISKLKEKAEADGFAPMDLLVNIKGAKTDTLAKSSSRPKSKTSVSVHRKRCESSSSGESSSDDEIAAKQHMKPQRKKKPETDSYTAKSNNNKENNGTASDKGKRFSLGSLSSAASSGSSLASSDDSSIESLTPVKLGMNHEKMTQYERSATSVASVGKKANAKSEDVAVTYDLSLSSDDDDDSIDLPPKEMGKAKCRTPPKPRSSAALRSSSNSINSDCSLETPKSSGLRNKPATKSSNILTVGLSKRRLELDASPKDQSKAASSAYSLFGGSNNKVKRGSARTQRRRKSEFPSSSSSVDTSPSRSNSSGGPAGAKSSTLLQKCSSSSDFVQIVKGSKPKVVRKKRLSPSSDLSSSDESESNQQIAKKAPKKPLLRQQSSDDSVGSIKRHCKSNNADKQSGRERPTANHDVNTNLGWTQGKVGWEKGLGNGGFKIIRTSRHETKRRNM